MTCWAVIAVRAPGSGKTRLAAALSDDQRRDLVGVMLHHVVAAVRAADGVDRVLLLGRSRHDLPDDIPLIEDEDAGLSAAATTALAAALAAAADRLILLPADLPKVRPEDVARLAQAQGFAIAPDRHGSGTNALSLPLPAAGGFRFRYGPRSFAAHHIEAERLRLDISIIAPPGLAEDVDRPEDLGL